MADVVDRRSHASQLARLHRFYDPARVLVLQLELCRRDPLGQYRRTLEFLGVRDATFAPRRLRRKAAGKPESMAVATALRFGLPEGTRRRVLARLGRIDEREAVALWPDIEASLHTALDPEVRALAETVPGFDLSRLAELRPSRAVSVRRASARTCRALRRTRRAPRRRPPAPRRCSWIAVSKWRRGSADRPAARRACTRQLATSVAPFQLDPDDGALPARFATTLGAPSPLRVPVPRVGAVGLDVVAGEAGVERDAAVGVELGEERLVAAPADERAAAVEALHRALRGREQRVGVLPRVARPTRLGFSSSVSASPRERLPRARQLLGDVVEQRDRAVGAPTRVVLEREHRARLHREVAVLAAEPPDHLARARGRSCRSRSCGGPRSAGCRRRRAPPSSGGTGRASGPAWSAPGGRTRRARSCRARATRSSTSPVSTSISWTTLSSTTPSRRPPSSDRSQATGT